MTPVSNLKIKPLGNYVARSQPEVICRFLACEQAPSDGGNYTRPARSKTNREPVRSLADSIRYSESVFYLSRCVHDVQRNVISFQFKIMSVD